MTAGEDRSSQIIETLAALKATVALTTRVPMVAPPFDDLVGRAMRTVARVRMRPAQFSELSIAFFIVHQFVNTVHGTLDMSKNRPDDHRLIMTPLII